MLHYRRGGGATFAPIKLPRSPVFFFWFSIFDDLIRDLIWLNHMHSCKLAKHEWHVDVMLSFFFYLPAYGSKYEDKIKTNAKQQINHNCH